jgi:hypothetical protein
MLAIGASSAIFLTGCFGSSEPIEGEWTIAESARPDGLDTYTVDIDDNSFQIKTEFSLDMTGEDEENFSITIDFDYDIEEKNDNEYTLEVSNIEADVVADSLEESQVDQIRESTVEDITSGDSKITVRLEDDDETLVLTSEDGEETKFERV